MENYVIIAGLGGEGIGGIRRVLDDAFIPIDENNRDYQAYLAWVGAGSLDTQ